MATVRLGALVHASPADVAGFMGDAAPRPLLEAVRAATDDELHALAPDAEHALALVEALVSRIDDLAVPAQLSGLDATVRWELPQPAGAGTTVRISAAGTAVTDADADVVVRGTTTQLLRLVAGQLDVAVAFLGGSIAIEGPSATALALASLFSADGSAPVTGTPVDALDIDPLDIGRVLHGVPADHLRWVMASDFRPVVLEEIFARMPTYVNGRKAAGVQITVGFRLTGRPDGEVDRYVLRLSDGAATVLAGPAADAVDPQDRHATVTCDAADFLRLVTGHLSVVTGVLRGQLKVQGDKMAAFRLNSAFDIPTAVAG
jgi:putative sterol carrier protein